MTALALIATLALAPRLAHAGGGGGSVAVAAPDAAAKREAQALVTDGVALIQAKQYDAALGKFLDAYARYPSPKILLNVGSTLRDMGRLADAANAYARYLEDPGPGAERVAEVKQLLGVLDQRVGILVVEITPAGADVSIDGGPWTTIETSTSARIAVGAHMVRARKDALTPAEVPVQGVAGQRNRIAITLKPVREAHDAALDEPTPSFMEEADAEPAITAPAHARAHASPADAHVELSLQARLDGRGRGGALAIGAAVDPWQALQLEAALLLSQDGDRDLVYGAYAGTRVHLLTGRLRPLIGAGAPIFWSGGIARVGARVGAGLELLVTDHLGLLADVGVEHFFNPQPGYATNLLVPIVGVQGRM